MNRFTELHRIAIATSVAFAALGSSLAYADHDPRAQSGQRAAQPSNLTRAEVVSDLKAYQDSGLAAAERVQLEQGREAEDLQPARERYAVLTKMPGSQRMPLSRSEVLADLKIYQESGLATAERVAQEHGIETEALKVARERYAMLRHGERYAALVMQFAKRTGEQAPQVRGG